MVCGTYRWLCGGAPIANTATTAAASAGTRCSLLMKLKRSSKFNASCCTNFPGLDSASRSYRSGLYGSGKEETKPVGKSPQILRKWIEAADGPSLSQERFTVVSYNILADRNASKHKDLYLNVPYSYINWDDRKRVICNELIEWNADIICLQEVDRYFDLLSILEKAGYIGSYKRRTGNIIDGCAMFWKPDKFRFLEGEAIEFEKFSLRDNIAQLSVFEMCNADSRRVVIGNIHVLYYPTRGDVKIGQSRFLSSRAHILSKKWGNAPVVLAGDFNSTPQSAIYKFLSTSELDIMAYNRREMSGQYMCHPDEVLGIKKASGSMLSFIDRCMKNSWTDAELRVATGETECKVVVHPLKLNSSYASLKGFEPLATSYHSKFFGTVDYIWYSHGITPTKILDTVPVDVLQKTGGLPCEQVGSDHLGLVSEFAFTQTTEEGKA